ncbi:hypothetical protein D3C75_1184860 [compost metagenome]
MQIFVQQGKRRDFEQGMQRPGITHQRIRTSGITEIQAEHHIMHPVRHRHDENQQQEPQKRFVVQNRLQRSKCHPLSFGWLILEPQQQQQGRNPQRPEKVGQIPDADQ